MRALTVVIVCCIAFLAGGCGIIDKEIHNRGGYLDYLLDEHWIKADSKQMRALRALAIHASLARVASVAPKTMRDRGLLANRIVMAAESAEVVLQCAFGPNPTKIVAAANDPCFFFDSTMLDYSVALFDLAMVSLPLEDAKHLIELIPASFTNPASALELLNALIVVGRDALKYGRVVGALYRDSIELEVQVWLAAPGQYKRPPGSLVPEDFRVTLPMIKNLYDIYQRGNDDMPAWQQELATLRATKLQPVPDIKFVDELIVLIKYMCKLVDTKTAVCDNAFKSWPSMGQVSGSPANVKVGRLYQIAPRNTNTYVWRYMPRT